MAHDETWFDQSDRGTGVFSQQFDVQEMSVLTALRAEILSYSRSRGLFAGLELSGAVVKQDPDPTKELPLADVDVTALYRGDAIGGGKSDASGAYTVLLRNRLWIGDRSHRNQPRPLRLRPTANS